MMRFLILPAIAMLTIAAMPSTFSGDSEGAIRKKLELSSSDKIALIDLNGDGVAEVLVYSTDREFCGSGGCDLSVLTKQAEGYRRVADIGPARLPIRVLAMKTNRWSDLGVEVGGGGIRHFYEARLRFDGKTYPDNPTVAPAIPLAKATGPIVIE